MMFVPILLCCIQMLVSLGFLRNDRRQGILRRSVRIKELGENGAKGK